MTKGKAVHSVFDLENFSLERPRRAEGLPESRGAWDRAGTIWPTSSPPRRRGGGPTVTDVPVVNLRLPGMVPLRTRTQSLTPPRSGLLRNYVRTSAFAVHGKNQTVTRDLGSGTVRTYPPRVCTRATRIASAAHELLALRRRSCRYQHVGPGCRQLLPDLLGVKVRVGASNDLFH